MIAMTSGYSAPEEPDLVRPEDSCPGCGERNIDALLWIDDEQVRCSTCGRQYRPGEARHD